MRGGTNQIDIALCQLVTERLFVVVPRFLETSGCSWDSYFNDIAVFFYSRSEKGQISREKYRDMASGTTTSTWSLQLIFRPKRVLISTTKPPNMSFKLQVEVVEPDVMSLYFSRQNSAFWYHYKAKKKGPPKNWQRLSI